MNRADAMNRAERAVPGHPRRRAGRYGTGRYGTGRCGTGRCGTGRCGTGRCGTGRAAGGTVAARRALRGDACLYMISMLSAMGPFWPMRVIMRTR